MLPLNSRARNALDEPKGAAASEPSRITAVGLNRGKLLLTSWDSTCFTDTSS
jgi:hypothetical protein